MEVHISDPTWGNHNAIFSTAGLVVKKYRYLDRVKNALDFDGMLADVNAAPAGSVILLHACAGTPPRWLALVGPQLATTASSEDWLLFGSCLLSGLLSAPTRNHDAGPTCRHWASPTAPLPPPPLRCDHPLFLPRPYHLR